jgi:hypothetical protein
MNAELSQPLSAVLDFTPEELALNRQGEMSQRQRDKVRQLLTGRALIYGFYSVVGVIAFWIAWSAIAADWQAYGGDIGRLWTEGSTFRQAMIIILVLVPVIITLYILAWLIGAVAFWRGVIKTAHGSARVTDASQTRGRLPFVVVGGVYFQVQPSALPAFIHGGVYTIHYLPMRPTHAILSAETAQNVL